MFLGRGYYFFENVIYKLIERREDLEYKRKAICE